VTGALTVRGRTRRLSFDAAASVPGDGEVWLDAEVHINRADFGLTWNLMGMASMNNSFTIHAVFTQPPRQGADHESARGRSDRGDRKAASAASGCRGS
jgi:hypothetical protein